MMRKTKIVATISDIHCDVQFIQSLYDAGMNVARINTAHINLLSGKKIIENIRAVSENIAILIDTKGPEIRTCGLQGNVNASTGQIITMSHQVKKYDASHVCVNYRHFTGSCSIGDRILFDDGKIEVVVEQKKAGMLYCRVENSGIIKNNKSVNVPGVVTNLPAVSEKDIEFIKFAEVNAVDFIAHSFVRNKEDVIEIQKLLNELNSPIKIIAKIENLEGVEKIDEILEHAYGIMVARGDLGIEVSAEKIPTIQRNIIRKAIMQKKPVIIATQMLHSMIDNPRPTRAEVNDVASAVYSRTDAVMLSGETAIGLYPVESIKMMARIAGEVEKDRDKHSDVIISPPENNEIPAYLVHAAMRAAKDLKPAAIIASTASGRTARYLASYRADIPVFTKCHSQKVVRELSLSFGIIPSILEKKKNRRKIQKATIKNLIAMKIIHTEDLIIYVSGKFGDDCGSTFIEISTAGKILKQKRKNNITEA